MLLKIYPENPEKNKIEKAVQALKDGEIIIYPTDTVYAFGCDSTNAKALEKLAKIKGIKLKKANFSLLCADLSHLSQYTSPLNKGTFKLMKRVLPGPFTFILPANNSVPNLFMRKKKSIGIRVPDNNIVKEIIETLGNPIVSTSLKDEDEILEYSTDPELIHDQYEKKVSMVIDGGPGNNVASTIVDCTDFEPALVRQGAGII